MVDKVELAKISWNVLTNCARRGTKAIKFGKSITTKSSFRIGTPMPINNINSPITKSIQEMQGATILAEQNKASFSFGKKTVDALYNEYLMQTTPNIAGTRRKFFEATKLQLHCPTTMDLSAFTGGLQNLENAIKGIGKINCNTPQDAVKMILPKDVKHVLIGHGVGSAATNNWCFYENGINVFEYINKLKLPKGEKFIVMTCETGTQNATKRAIGGEVSTLLTDTKNPAKIVEVGRNEIIGEFVLPPFGSGVRYY